MFKKRDMIIIVCTISVVVMGLVFWKTFSCKKQDKLSSIVRAYQLPNGMFCDTLATDEEIDTFSTCYMNKIHRVLDIKDTTQIKEKIELSYNSIDEIYLLKDTTILLTDEECEKYGRYLESISDDRGIIHAFNQENMNNDLIFTYYSMVFSHQYGISLNFEEDLKKEVYRRNSAVSEVDELQYVCVLLELSDILKVAYNRDFYINYYNVKKRYYMDSANFENTTLNDIYYLGRIKSILNVEDTLAEHICLGIVASMELTYTTLSDFYNSILILKQYGMLEQYRDTVEVLINTIKTKYEVEPQCYRLICTETPSIIGTYFALEILIEENQIDDKTQELIARYCINCYEDGRTKTFSSEDLLYYYKTVEVLLPEYCEDKKFIRSIYNQMNNILFEDRVLSIRELYCLTILSEKLEINLYRDTLCKKFTEILKNVSVAEVSTANKCMLMITYKILDISVQNFRYDYKLIENSIMTTMDAYYYIDYCKVYGYVPSCGKMYDVIQKLKNEHGYYVSENQKLNTIQTVYLGHMVEKYIENNK